jgi:conjugative transposon TraN protein
MKTLLFILSIFLSLSGFAQLPVIYLPPDVSIHFISPEPITYVDISTKQIIGDLPLKNVLRIKSLPDSLNRGAVLTITGEKFIAQYQLIRSKETAETRIEIGPTAMYPIDVPGISLSHPEMKRYALAVISAKTKALVTAKDFGMKMQLNRLYSLDDYLFLDVGFQNTTHINFDIEALRFTVEDRKTAKATNVQSFEVAPEYILTNRQNIKKYFRNIYVFKKFTFPGNKVLHMQLSEKQVSGRVIDLRIRYQQVLDAEMLKSE